MRIGISPRVPFVCSDRRVRIDIASCQGSPINEMARNAVSCRCHLMAFSFAVIISGCASTYVQEVVTAPTAKLERGKAVLVATPKNGTYDAIEYPLSGQQTVNVVQSAFARYSDRVDVSSDCVNLTCLRTAGADAYTYLVVPEILHWEDRATEWSGRPDRIEIKLVVFDAQINRVASSTVISGKSKWATLGGDHPQDLLPDPIKQYVGSLY